MIGENFLLKKGAICSALSFSLSLVLSSTFKHRITFSLYLYIFITLRLIVMK